CARLIAAAGPTAEYFEVW
nr:immunoglobulin heavy chain junction region [Macaca mulatta]